MDLDAFLTTQVSQAASAKQNNAAAKASSTRELGALSFIDFIIARVTASQAQTALDIQKKTASGAATSTDDASRDSGKPKLDLAQLLAATPEIREQVKKLEESKVFDGDPQALIAAVLQMNQGALAGTIIPDGAATTNAGITAGVPGKTPAPSISKTLLIDSEKDRKALLGKLSAILSKLQKLSQDGDGTLTLANLSPDQITALKAKIETLLAKFSSGGNNAKGSTAASVNAETGLLASDATAITTAAAESGDKPEDKKDKEDDDLAGILIGLIKLLPPQAQPEVVVLPQGLMITPRPLGIETAGAQNPALKAANDISSKLNDLTQAAGSGAGDDSDGIPAPQGKLSFDQLLKQLSDKKSPLELSLALTAAKNSADAPAAPSVSAGSSALLGFTFEDPGSLTATSEALQKLLDNLGIQVPGVNITGLAASINLITQAPSAAAAHPAAQLVAATIQKAAADGEDRQIFLQLDPPDLGKIEVRLSFGKDKSVKAVVTAEHSDTYTMLQRDGHVLERALFNAGVDADGSSLSFELAGDGYFNNQGGGGNNGGSNARKVNEIEDITHSTMSWYVDPATGNMRYDIMA